MENEKIDAPDGGCREVHGHCRNEYFISLSTSEICANITADFKKRRITHKIAAELIGTSKQTVSNQISGKKRFSKNMAQKFSEAFGYSVTWLLYGTGEMFTSTSGYVGKHKTGTREEEKRVVISMRVSEQTAAIYQRLSWHGVAVGRIIDDLMPIVEKLMSFPVNEQEALLKLNQGRLSRMDGVSERKYLMKAPARICIFPKDSEREWYGVTEWGPNDPPEGHVDYLRADLAELTPLDIRTIINIEMSAFSLDSIVTGGIESVDAEVARRFNKLKKSKIEKQALREAK